MICVSVHVCRTCGGECVQTNERVWVCASLYVRAHRLSCFWGWLHVYPEKSKLATKIHNDKMLFFLLSVTESGICNDNCFVADIFCCSTVYLSQTWHVPPFYSSHSNVHLFMRIHWHNTNKHTFAGNIPRNTSISWIHEATHIHTSLQLYRSLIHNAWILMTINEMFNLFYLFM